MITLATLALFGLASLLYFVWYRSRSGAGPSPTASVLFSMLFLLVSAIALGALSLVIGWLWMALLVVALWAAVLVMLVARAQRGAHNGA